MKNRRPSQKILDVLAKNLRDRRVERELTQVRLAELCDCSDKQISQIQSEYETADGALSKI